MACTWFGEISFCSSLTALPGPTWVLLGKICKPFAGFLYTFLSDNEEIIYSLDTGFIL